MIRAFVRLLFWLLMLAAAMVGVSLGLLAMVLAWLWWLFNAPMRIVRGIKWAR